jgi:hypothetical protein
MEEGRIGIDSRGCRWDYASLCIKWAGYRSPPPALPLPPSPPLFCTPRLLCESEVDFRRMLFHRTDSSGTQRAYQGKLLMGLKGRRRKGTHGTWSLLLLLSKWLRKRLSSTREVLDPLESCIHLLAVPEPRRVGENADAIAVDSSTATEKAQNWDIYISRRNVPQCFDGNRCERYAPKTLQKKFVVDAPQKLIELLEKSGNFEGI